MANTIRKQFEFDGMHIVRNCSSQRCKYSIHAHTYQVEIFLTSSKLDLGHMVMDFGLMKNNIKDVIKSFDRAASIWKKEEVVYTKFLTDNMDRWVLLPMNPSAESYASYFFAVVNSIIRATEFKNGEGDIYLSKVRVHETRSGWAECTNCAREIDITDTVFSATLRKGWESEDLWFNTLRSWSEPLSGFKPFKNPTVKLQIIDD